MTPAVHGTTAPGFEALRVEFAAVGHEEGAQLAVHVDGEPVADLWRGPGVEGDSLMGVFSSTKGAAFAVVALLVQQGALDLDREVAFYWPEFAVEGKGAATVRDLLGHRVGALGTDEGLTLDEVADDRAAAARIAGHRPYWRPGAALGYHALSVGALAGEVVRRVTGHTLQEEYERRLRRPFGLDFFLGLPEGEEHRVLPVLPPLDPPPQGPRDGLAGIAGNRHHPGMPELAELPNLRVIRAGGPASVGGVASARGLAGLYAAVIGGLCTGATLAECALVSSAGHDLVLGTHRVHGLGFMVGWPFLGAGAFGHDGAGGSMAFADPRAGLAFGYARRRFPSPGGAGQDAERLATVARACALARQGRRARRGR
ncbi:class A beta-lactamase-related serine hydrolase [Streptomyces radicis]|uniref:Class A beta-lactamase-related serine hydrolase n=1 Tax=Streptomyces radicis TaxID=1750517 RepID=A0A3A9VSY7_9ACTN|nr:serine hydrolase domain-containing protein [Streptomyces radicis]RKN03672.1 class A beta-lactamase-related serine hydrolase [Streptomyces radicis]RKN13516.1 class A beta-lactamase-related serine hydrolase [Streptomyces radicis]